MLVFNIRTLITFVSMKKIKPSPRKFGWKPDLPDQRDLKYMISRKLTGLVTTNNRGKYLMPPILDQGSLGSCTSNGCSSIMNFLFLNGHFQAQPKKSPVPFSRLFIYYNERVIEKTVSQDAGAQIRDGVKVLAKYGVCSEATVPYDVNQFAKKPSPSAYKTALGFTALSYSRLDNTKIEQMVDCLNNGFPFVFGFTVYDSFESDKVAKTGIVPMPKKTEKSVGGHCVWCIDYDAVKKGFWCVNSWGDSWGAKCQFFMPQAYLTDTNLADDFWTIRIIK